MHQSRGVVLVTVRGDVDGDPAALRMLGGAAVQATGRRPALVDLSDLHVHHRSGLAALHEVVQGRPAGTATVVLTRTSMRRRLTGLFGPDVAWYPAGVHVPWVGVAASLSHRRRRLPAAQRTHPVADPLGELVWAAARERAGAR